MTTPSAILLPWFCFLCFFLLGLAAENENSLVCGMNFLQKAVVCTNAMNSANKEGIVAKFVLHKDYIPGAVRLVFLD